jgi:hypothetical protein
LNCTPAHFARDTAIQEVLNFSQLPAFLSPQQSVVQQNAVLPQPNPRRFQKQSPGVPGMTFYEKNFGSFDHDEFALSFRENGKPM